MDAKKAILPMAVWIGVGTAIGLAHGNLALWLGFSVLFGLATGYYLNRKR